MRIMQITEFFQRDQYLMLLLRERKRADRNYINKFVSAAL